MIKKVLLILIYSTSIIYAQDSTISEAFKKKPFFNRHHIFQPKYQSYPLVAGYILTKEANSGDPFAQHELGLRYLMGRGFSADTAKAVYWIQKAASQNLATAEFNLGIMLLNGIGTPWNPFEAFKYFGKAANAGMPEAAYIYGVIFTDNLVVNRNLNEAYKWASFAAEHGNEAAQKLKLRLEEYGITESLNTDSTLTNTFTPHYDPNKDLISNKWELDFVSFEEDSLIDSKEKEVVAKILNRKSSELKNYIGYNYSADSLKDTSNFSILKIAANNGSPEALTLIGKSYELGIGVPKNILKAAYYYLRAFRMGARKPISAIIEMTKEQRFFDLLKDEIDKNNNAEAMYVWAALTALGFDYQLTDQQALDLLLKASEQNHIASLIESGIIYLTGSMVEKDTAKAIEYWTKAEQLGSSEGKIRNIFLQLTIQKNHFAEKDKIDYLKQAANSGSVIAHSVLAYCFEHGYGVKQDKAQASELYRNAARRGSEAAYTALKKMYDEIRPRDEIFNIYNN